MINDQSASVIWKTWPNVLENLQLRFETGKPYDSARLICSSLNRLPGFQLSLPSCNSYQALELSDSPTPLTDDQVKHLA